MKKQTITYKPLFGMRTVIKQKSGFVSVAAVQAKETALRLAKTSQIALAENNSIMLQNIYLHIELYNTNKQCRYELRSETDDSIVGQYVFSWQNPTGGCFMTPDKTVKLHLI